MARRLDKFARSRVASAEDTTVEELNELASDEDWCVRESVAKNPASPSPLLDLLAEDAHWAVRCGVASNANAPKEVLLRLAEDEDSSVRAAVVNNPATPGEVLDSVTISPSEWARPLFGIGVFDGRANETSLQNTDGVITLRNVSVSWRLISSSQVRPCLEIRMETSWPGFMDANTACLYMDDSGFRRMLRLWMTGAAFRRVKILDSVSNSELGALFSAAIAETCGLCADNNLKSVRDLKNNELVDWYVDAIAVAAQNALDEHYPIRGNK